MTTIDLHFRGRPHVIAAAALQGPGGLALIDPGPASCLPALEAGLAAIGRRLEDVRQILLTHIHLDHAGATGSIVARAPSARVLVHERGAPHMVDPTKLLASATRLYGDQMDTLWGRFDPTPVAQVTPLTGGEEIDVVGRRFHVAYTPGHAVHHVSYLDDGTGTAYVGDTCGIRVVGDYTIAATPPPDIDLALWRASLDALEEWQPATLFLTHFGEVNRAGAHIAHYRAVLTRTAESVAQSLAAGDADEDRVAAFVTGMRTDARLVLSETEAQALELAAPFDQVWAGLARYWRKQPVQSLTTPDA